MDRFHSCFNRNYRFMWPRLGRGQSLPCHASGQRIMTGMSFPNGARLLYANHVIVAHRTLIIRCNWSSRFESTNLLVTRRSAIRNPIQTTAFHYRSSNSSRTARHPCARRKRVRKGACQLKLGLHTVDGDEYAFRERLTSLHFNFPHSHSTATCTGTAVQPRNSHVWSINR